MELFNLKSFLYCMAISFNENFEFNQIILYLSGIVISGIAGFISLNIIKHKESKIHLNQFHGLVSVYPKTAFVFLLSCLGLWGFPITSTFIGEDLIYSHIHQNQLFLASLISISFIVDGLSLIRMFSRLFLGTYTKGYHEIPLRSS